MKNILIIAISFIGILLLTLLIGRIYFSIDFNKQVTMLFALSKNSSNRTYHQTELDSLPEPVQRYFKHVLKEGQPYIRSVRMTHVGQFKTGMDKDWTDITGEQYATTDVPGFIWKGTTSLFVARDLYIDGRGQLIVTLLSLVNVVDGKGEKYNQGELLRWLGESVLYPTNFLPNERLKWFPIDHTSAKLTYTYNGLELFFNFTFNELGEITEMETKRYMDETKLETWVIKLAEYKEINSVVIPTAFEVLWRLDTGDFSYAKFKMTQVEYNKPERF